MDPSMLIGVLTQGQEQARQLLAQLDEPFNDELLNPLVRNIHKSFETAISMAKVMETESMRKRSGSPQSGGSDSPRSDNSDLVFKDQEQREMMCKKRKNLPKWSSQVRVCLGGGVEGPLDDGYAWRKYGQKDILGAKYPRGYYRCTHRNSQGCLATKQVQRSDDDPSIFDVSYCGIHTCVEKHQKPQPSRKESPNTKQGHEQQLLASLKASLNVKTEGLDMTEAANSSSFSFPSTPMSLTQSQSSLFFSPLDNNFTNAFSPHYFSTMSNYELGSNVHVHGSESGLADIVSGTSSQTNSPIMNMDFSISPVEFDPSFHFDSSNFF